jgi:UDP-glucose 4-epimerase
MRTILVLGGWGFLGLNLLLAIEKRFQGACKIVVLDRHISPPLRLLCPALKKVYFGDFQDVELLQRIFTENAIDVVFHLASSTVPETSANVRFDVESNLLPTIDLLEQMAKYSVNRIVYISSGGAVYGISSERHKEIDETFPINSYGIVKVAIEKYLFMYAHQYGILPLVVRLSNPYGPYHAKIEQGFINVALRAALCGESVQVWGDGNNRKDYIFADDGIASILDLVEVGAWGQIVNVGSGEEYSLNEILGVIKETVPNFTWRYSGKRSFDTPNFSLDINKLNYLTNQRQPIGIRQGIQQTYRWLLDHSIHI